MMSLIPFDSHTVEEVFLLCAVGGTLFFALRVALLLLGGFSVGELDLNGDGVVDAQELSAGYGSAETDVAFKLFSLNSISSFLLMFGWVGLAAHRQYQLGDTLSLLAAILGGLLLMGLTAYLFILARKLTSRGSEFSLEKTVGKTATVYLRIPPGGRGKIHISINGLLHELDAELDKQSGEQSTIASFSPVLITKVAGPSLVQVTRCSSH